MPSETSDNLILHAPNVHVGGGLNLLQALYSVKNFNINWEQVDRRAFDALPPSTGKRYWIKKSLLSRLGAEWRLWRQAKETDIVLCFHGLVPLFPLKGKVTVFLQNRILVSRSSLMGYPLRPRLRLMAERWMLKVYAARVHKFIVQTPSMADQTRSLLGSDLPVIVCPFVTSELPVQVPAEKMLDFIYIAGGDVHKNHLNLLRAWNLLSQDGLKPSLGLTVPMGSSLASELELRCEELGLNILNFGQISNAEVNRLYGSARALIYPSIMESLGLPLIEASQRGLPILASELDYVRDIVTPIETFDPLSPVSIARAVKRFLGHPNLPQPMFGAETFLEEVLR